MWWLVVAITSVLVLSMWMLMKRSPFPFLSLAHPLAPLPEVEYLIIGAGPAGLQMGALLTQANREVAIVEGSSQVASFFQQYPVHGRLISFNRSASLVHPSPEFRERFDWNRLLGSPPHIHLDDADLYPTREQYMHYLTKYAKYHQLPITFRWRVARLHKMGDWWEVMRDHGTGKVRAKVVLVATGMTPKPIQPIHGLQNVRYDELGSLGKETFRKKRVWVLGNGNAGMESAKHIAEVARHVHVWGKRPLQIAALTHYVGDVRARNLELLDQYQLKVLSAITEYDRELRKWRADGVRIPEQMSTQEVLRMLASEADIAVHCTGFQYVPLPGVTHGGGKYPATTPTFAHPDHPHSLFFLGALMHGRDYRKSAGGFVHGFRYLIQFLHQHLEWSRHQVPFPAEVAPSLQDSIQDRIQNSAALYLMHTHMCDMWISVEGSWRHLRGIPVEVAREWLAQRRVGPSPCGNMAYTLTFEYGKSYTKCAVLESREIPSHQHPEKSQFLHPVVTRYREGKALRSLHVEEDITVEWKRKEFLAPLHRWLQSGDQ